MQTGLQNPGFVQMQSVVNIDDTRGHKQVALPHCGHFAPPAQISGGSALGLQGTTGGDGDGGLLLLFDFAHSRPAFFRSSHASRPMVPLPWPVLCGRRLCDWGGGDGCPCAHQRLTACCIVSPRIDMMFQIEVEWLMLFFWYSDTQSAHAHAHAHSMRARVSARVC